MQLNVDRRALEDDERQIELTPREFDVLRVLLEADGAVVTKEELLARPQSPKAAS